MVIMIVGHAICSSTQASHCGEHFASQTMRSRTPPARARQARVHVHSIKIFASPSGMSTMMPCPHAVSKTRHAGRPRTFASAASKLADS
jgi:hypothetical protein